MQKRPTHFVGRLVLLLVCTVMIAGFDGRYAYAAPDEVGRYSDPVEVCQTTFSNTEVASLGAALLGSGAALATTGVGAAVGGAVAFGGATLALIAKLGEGRCEQLDDGIKRIFDRAYDDAREAGIDLGNPDGEVHYWVGGVMIQDFGRVRDDEGRIVGDGWAAILANGVEGSDAYTLFGSSWVAYKRAIYQPSVLGTGIFPGFPTSDQHQWNDVVIQDFTGGSWGGAAIIGGDQEYAWLVAGRHLKAYISADGSNTLGNPLGPVELNVDGWYEQKFEGGRILELAGETKVEFYDASDTPAELPAVGYEEPTAQPTQPSETSAPQGEAPENIAPTTDSGDPDCVAGADPYMMFMEPLGDGSYTTTTEFSFSFQLMYPGCDSYSIDIELVDLLPDGTMAILGTETYALFPGWNGGTGFNVVLEQPGDHSIRVDMDDGTGFRPIEWETGGIATYDMYVSDAGSYGDDSGGTSESYDLSQFEARCHYFWSDQGGWIANNCNFYGSGNFGEILDYPLMDGCNYLFDGTWFYQNFDYGCD